MKRSSAFTLVELLVVIAVLAVLTAIIFPALHLARNRGLSASCRNNLSQVGKAILMYADDNNRWLPPYATQTSYGAKAGGKAIATIIGNPKAWRESLASYTKSDGIFWCAADQHKSDKEFRGEFDFPQDHRQLYTSYQTGILFIGPDYLGENGTLQISLNDRRTLLFPYVHDVLWAISPQDPLRTHHGPRGNGLYADGHVRSELVGR